MERINREALSIERIIGGLDLRLSGRVRVATLVLLANRQLSPLAAAMRARYSDLALELCCCDHPAEAVQNGADIAVQLQPFAQPELVVRRIGRLGLRLYASSDYLRRRGGPDCESGCAGHDLLALTATSQSHGEAEWIAANAWQARVAMRTNCRETQLSAGLQGSGLRCCRLSAPIIGQNWCGCAHERLRRSQTSGSQCIRKLAVCHEFAPCWTRSQTCSGAMSSGPVK